MRILLSIFFFFTSSIVFAQGEANVWYFGVNAGIDFNGGAPVALTNGALSTSEGCAAISDPNGNLIFYTDGILVYNRNHTQMPNGWGLWGDPSSAQSALIVPQPGSTTRFIIFTVDAAGGPNGFAYSEVDLTLDNGNGDVVVSSKNTSLFSPSVEKLTAVKHTNGLDVWVISHGLNNNRYYAYLVDCNGVNAPVISDVGSVEGAPGWGCLAVSPNGLKLASAMRAVGFELLDFDPSTGIISNPLLLGHGGSCYGVAFSPNNNLLYGLSIQGGALLQWNLQAGTPANIIASVQNIGIAPGTGAGYNGGAIQQGPDGKLYIPDYGRPYLTAINNPNLIGVACDMQANAVDLLGRTAILGLPPFIQSYFDTALVINYNYEGACMGGTTDFYIGGNTTFFDSVHWHFDDPNSGSLNTSTDLSPSHSFTAPGAYNVQLIKYLDCIADTTTDVVTITPAPISTQSVSICANDSFTLPGGRVVYNAGVYNDTISDLNACDSIVVTTLRVDLVYQSDIYDTICAGDTYTLPDGSIVSSTGDYDVLFSSASNCDSTITTHLTVWPNTSSSISPSICANAFYTLPSGLIVDSSDIYLDTIPNRYACDSVITVNLTVYPTYSDTTAVLICANADYTLPDGLTVNSQGIYYSTLASINGCDSIITTLLDIAPIYNIDVYDTVCAGDTYLLPDTRIVDSEGVYINNLSSEFACDSVVNIYLTVLDPQITISKQDISCKNESDGTANASISGGLPPYTYLWSNASTNNSIIDLAPGIYTLQIEDAYSCSNTSSIEILEPDSLQFSSSIENLSCYESQDGTISISRTGGSGNIEFYVNGTLQSGNTAYDLLAGEYDLEIIDENNCSTTSKVGVFRPDSIAYFVDPLKPAMELGDSIDLFISSNFDPIAKYIWESAYVNCAECATPNVFFHSSDTLRGYVESISQNRPNTVCTKDIAIYIEVDESRNLFFPNAFSPNGDNNNEEYRLYGNLKSLRTFNFRIYDRWGELVFETDSPDFTWNGELSNSKDLFTSVYVYSAIYSFLGDKQKVYKQKGSITLLR